MNALSFENKKFNISEPFKGLFTQGMVCHETYKDKNGNWISPDEVISIEGKKVLENDNSHEVKVGPSESMSKSKKNTIDPEKIIKNYGADAVRLFILSDSPPERDIQWSEEGISASNKFIHKLWNLNLKILENIKLKNNEDPDNILEKNTNIFLNEVSNNLINFRYNKIVANFHQIYNEVFKLIDRNYSKETLVQNYKKILIAMNPVIPHFSNECLKLLDEKLDLIKWPKINEELIEEQNINYVIQINGKKRGIIQTEKGISEKNLIILVERSDDLKKYFVNKPIKKKIFIPNKLLNIIL
tara:strand:+ start:19 stop:918 length:900 start_codon:yes stop_codon:yes gene_type:complete